MRENLAQGTASAASLYPCLGDGLPWSLREDALSEAHFRQFSEFIHLYSGIKMPSSKKTMLEGRLLKRMRILGIDSFGRYCDYLFSDRGLKDELTYMIDVVTTNKTEFFREAAHFRFLGEIALPERTLALRRGNGRGLAVWSAGCSSGEEPYSLAMTLSEYAETTPGFHFSIMATDICTRVLEKARLGIYGHEAVGQIPSGLQRKYLLRSRDRSRKMYRISPELRGCVRFRRLNFMDEDFGIHQPMDVIFCRNVLIYFDRPTQERLLRKLGDHLAPGGFLFLGHSETLSGMDLPLSPVASTIYRKPL